MSTEIYTATEYQVWSEDQAGWLTIHDTTHYKPEAEEWLTQRNREGNPSRRYYLRKKTTVTTMEDVA